MAGTQVDKSVAIDFFQEAVPGFNSATLSTYTDGSTAPQLEAGARIEISQEIYQFGSLESITGWSGISLSTQAYIKFVPSGTSCTLEFTSVAPSYNAAKGGWYSGNDRYLCAVYKDGSGNYTNISYLSPNEVAKYYGNHSIFGTLAVSSTGTFGDSITINGNATLRLANAGDASSYSTFDDVSDNQLQINKINTGTGNVLVDINPINSTDTTQNQIIRFFRGSSARTGGAVSVLQMYSAGTSTIHNQFGVDGADSYFNGGGSIGIGTPSPAFGGFVFGLEIEHTSSIAGLRIQGPTTGALELYHNNGIGYIDNRNASANNLLVFHTNGTERLRLTAGKISTNGETAPDCDAGGITTHIGTGSIFLTAKNSSVDHGISGFDPDTFGKFGIVNDSNGGLAISGFRSVSPIAISIAGYSVHPLTSSDAGVITIVGYKGTTPGALADNEQLLTIQNNGTAVWKFLGNGAVGNTILSDIGTGTDTLIAYGDNVSHGISGFTTSAYGQFKINDATSNGGGLGIIGLCEDTTPALSIESYMVDPPDNTSGHGSIESIAHKGTTPGMIGGSEVIHAWLNHTTRVAMILGDGDMFINGDLTAGNLISSTYQVGKHNVNFSTELQSSSGHDWSDLYSGIGGYLETGDSLLASGGIWMSLGGTNYTLPITKIGRVSSTVLSITFIDPSGGSVTNFTFGASGPYGIGFTSLSIAI